MAEGLMTALNLQKPVVNNLRRQVAQMVLTLKTTYALYSCEHNTISSAWSLLFRTTCFGLCMPSAGVVFSCN
jgi:hypothetical protein